MRNKLIILSILFFFFCISCNSNKPEHDTDNLSDTDTFVNDDLQEDSDSYDEESEDDIELEDDFDEIPDISYPDPTCIEIYDGDPESELCFGPVKTNVKCNASPKDGEYVTVLEEDNPIGGVSDPMDLNDDFVFFPIYPNNANIRANIYGCSRIDGYLYEIVSSKYNNQFFTVDDDLMVFVVWESDSKLLLGNLKTNELKELKDWGGYGKLQLNYPFLTYLGGVRNPHIFNLETNETTKIDNLFGSFPRNDGKNLVITGYYLRPGEKSSESPFGESAWVVDMETFEIRPLIMSSLVEYDVFIEGDYAFIHSGRDLVYYENYPGKCSGMDIYAFNLKTKREEKFTPKIKGIIEGNNTVPSFEYPYFHYLANEKSKIDTGASFVYNVETQDVTELWSRIGQELPYVKDRHVVLGGYYRNGVAKLPDLPREHDDSQCFDENICTDDRYFVTDGKCHYLPNHERCDDGDDTTELDVCVEGTCQGFKSSGTVEEMVKISSGSFIYDGLEYEMDYSFLIDVFEVTNSDYKKCVEAKACVSPLKTRSINQILYYENPLYENYPVLYVNQPEAQIYCNWIGKRLPTEFEWMKATWDGEEKTYLWGEEEPTEENFYANTTVGHGGLVGFDTAEVGTFPYDKTVSGVMDMSGNVKEWTTSEWTYDLCEEPPCVGYFGSDLVVVKGGGFWEGPEIKKRHPYTPWSHSFYVGFRCVKIVKQH